MSLVTLLPHILLALGVGFFFANLWVGLELARWVRRRSTALLVWPAKKPPQYGLSLGIGVTLGLLVLVKAYLAWRQTGQLLLLLQLFPQFAFGGPAYLAWRQTAQLILWLLLFPPYAFGELMMFVYFGYMLPFSTRITRGLYGEGIWTDSAFMPYDEIGGITWREGRNATLVIISRSRALARRLEVPSQYLGEVRRLLRDKIGSHAIEIDAGPGLHLGSRDARDSV